MNIFVISLKRSLDRREEFDKSNKNIINYEYFDAVDGEKYIPKKKSKIINYKSFVR